MDSVQICHFGIHDSGIHGEILTNRTRNDPMVSENIQLMNIRINSINNHPSYTHTTTFTGINVTVMGDGEGGNITLSGVSVRRTTSGNDISIVLVDRVHGFNVQLNAIQISDTRRNITEDG